MAIALAAQDVLKNVFGTITLLGDRPFRVGERIMVDKYDGFVEDIGLRSVRLRLLSGNLVTIPNDRLAAADVENISNRQYLRRVSTIHFPLNTSREEMELALRLVREQLDNHEGMNADRPPASVF